MPETRAQSRGRASLPAPPEEPKVRTNITIDPGLLEEVRDLARRNHRSFSGQVALILDEWLEHGGYDGGPR